MSNFKKHTIKNMQKMCDTMNKSKLIEYRCTQKRRKSGQWNSLNLNKIVE